MMNFRVKWHSQGYLYLLVALGLLAAIADPSLAGEVTAAAAKTEGAGNSPSSAAGDAALAPAFTRIQELTQGFEMLYTQRYPQAREKFDDWASRNPREPFGEVAVAASYLFEEFYRQGVLSSDFFLNEKKFLGGIDGKPDPEIMDKFQDALVKTRAVANERLKQNPNDTESLFALTLAAGMESDADMILRKERFEALKQLKAANEYAKRLLQQRPDANDAYVALGSANYIIGSLSTGFKFLLAFDGVHGDKKLGMQQLGKSADSGLYLRPFAKIMLALAARREKQNQLAQKLLLELTEEYTASPLFAAEYAKAMGRPVPATMHP